ncbi:hypothetical protein SHELI_v1c05790 [Spiroplasma helicoides]|uniref:Lipoprotein n=1 Tax=Spiroplasma helicoides TaxID=216938 RepID=A0A1B3SKT5_9MOLU|nr:hypothetical protein [Spiroplasma helicoides]AOG60530.1 hypothetical protein SHELI_v1c05790 [Spiroplasma helicoides]
MKKLLYLLSSISFITQTLVSVVACNKGNEKVEENNGVYDPKTPDFSIDPNLTNMQNQMKTGAEVISRIIIASRHENLNYNMNEILSSYLTPYTSEMNMPSSYNYKGRNINLGELINRYKNLLVPSMEKINLGVHSGIYSSYIMGMYDDSFYQSFIDKGYFEDGFNETGDSGFNKLGEGQLNEMGILMGMNKNLSLSEDENRRNLAWGIQDNGALSNYLLSKGFDGGYPGGSNGTNTPYLPANRKGDNGGTNGAGYLYYNSILASGKSKVNDFEEFKNKLIKDKIKDTNYDSADILNGDYSSSVDGINFNYTGALMTMKAGILNLKGYINKFATLKDSVSESDYGADSLLTFANYMTPMLSKPTAYTDVTIQGAVSSLLYNSQEAINIIQDEKNSKSLQDFLTTNGFNENILKDKINIRPAIGIRDLLSPTPESVSVQNFYKKNDSTDNKDIVDNPLENLNKVATFLNEIASFQSNLSENLKKEFVDKFFKTENTPFGKSYQLIINPKVEGLIDLGGLTQSGWEECMGSDGSKAADLLKLISKAYEGLAKEDTQKTINVTVEKYKNKVLSDLNRTEKNTLLENLGYNVAEKKYKDNSFLKNYYSLLSDTSISGVNELNNLFEFLKKGVDDSIAPVHERATQYINNKEYWKTSDIKIDATDPTEVNGKMEFTLEYNGVGDSDSNADQQTKKVNVPQNFNPYQTIVDNQKDFANLTDLKSKIDLSKKSGEILGKEQLNMSDEQIMKYDGLAENYQNVNHKYKVVWKNVSNDVENPYWIIVDIKSYNKNGEEFFNIY